MAATNTSVFFTLGSATEDADHDELEDAREILIHRTAVVSPDSDGDGMTDGWEVRQRLDPLASDATADADADGFANFFEFLGRSDSSDEGLFPSVYSGTNVADDECRGTVPDLAPTGMSASLVFTQLPPAGAAADIGEQLVILAVRDAQGAWGRRPFLVHVKDETPPVVAPLAPLWIEKREDVPAPDGAGVYAEDACGGTAIEHISDADNAGTGCENDPLAITRLYRVADEFGNAVICTQMIILAGHQVMAVDAPPDITQSMNESTAPAHTGEPVVRASCCGDVFFSHADAVTGDCTLVITRAWTASNSCGDMVVVTQRITVADTTPPALFGVPPDLTIGCGLPIPGAPDVTAEDESVQRPPAAGLVLSFNCDEIVDGYAIDSSTNRISAPTTNVGVDPGGRRNNAYVFDGVHSRVEVPDPGVWQSGSFTAIAWVKTTGAGAGRRLVLHRSAALFEWWVGLQDDVPAFGSTQDGLVKTVGSPMSDGQWHMLVLVRDAGARQVRGYVDAVEVFADPSFPSPPPPPGAEHGLTIGAAWDGSEAFGGLADSVQLYARVLSVGELEALALGQSLEMLVAVEAEETSDFSTTCAEITRIWRATDRCGNTAAATQVVSVVDVAAPVLSGVPGDTILTWPEPMPAPASIAAHDFCDGTTAVTVVEYREGGDPAVIRRAWRAVDSCGNVAVATQAIAVLQGDVDGDGLGDFWEHALVDADTNDALVAIEEVDPADDFDNDGLVNAEEYARGTDALAADTDRDWIGDGHEVNDGTNPSDPEDGASPWISINGDSLYASSATVMIRCAVGMVADTIIIEESGTLLGGTTNTFAPVFAYPWQHMSNGWRRLSVRLHRSRAPQDLFAQVDLLLDTEPPVLVVTNPVQDAATSRRWIRLEGTVRDEAGPARVRINGEFASGLTSDTFWHNRVSLTPGTNVLHVTAEDMSGHVVTQFVRVVQDVAGDTMAPVVLLHLPRDYAIVGGVTSWFDRATYGSSPELYVEGTCDDDSAQVWLAVEAGGVTNGPYSAQLSGSRVWGRVALAEGSNVVRILGRDAAGNTGSSSYVVVRDTSILFEITNPPPYKVVNSTGVVVQGRASLALRAAQIRINGVLASVHDLGDRVEFETVGPVGLGDGLTTLLGTAEMDGRSIYCDPQVGGVQVLRMVMQVRDSHEVILDRCNDFWTKKFTIDSVTTFDMLQHSYSACSTYFLDEFNEPGEFHAQTGPTEQCDEGPFDGNLVGKVGYSSSVTPLVPHTDSRYCTAPAGGSELVQSSSFMWIKPAGAEFTQGPVMLRFEGLWFDGISVPTDPAQITFRGQRGFVDEDGAIAFIVPMGFGANACITEADFSWPTVTGMDGRTRLVRHMLGFSGPSLTPLLDGVTGDVNHDGRIDLDDRILPADPGGDPGSPPTEDPASITNRVPTRMWINDDSDSGDVASGNSDTPGARAGVWEFDGREPNYDDSQVDGTCDLLDFFPVYLDVRELIGKYPPSMTTTYRLRQEDEAVNVVYADLTPDRAGSFQTTPYATGFGTGLSQNPSRATTVRITRDGVNVDPAFLGLLRNRGGGVLLLEGRAASTNPLVLEIVTRLPPGITLEVPLSISPVEDMYRWVNLRAKAGQAEVRHTEIHDPVNAPDRIGIPANFVFVHGYSVSEYDARGFAAEVFKRLWQSGARSKYTAVTWHGDQGQFPEWIPGLGGKDPDYYANVTNAFLTAQHLKEALAFMEGDPVVIAAHSLGNMVVSAAIQDFGLGVRKYLMIDAAVAVEAYDASVSHRDRMTAPYWAEYVDPNKPDNPYWLWSTEWHTLFATNDSRRGLTWRNRFRDVTNAVNYYSSTEDVLAPNPTSSMPGPGRDYSWVYQEMSKGSVIAALVSGLQSQGGWAFNYEAWHKEPVDPEWGFEILDPWEITTNSEERIREDSFFKRFDTDEVYGANGASVANDYMRKSVWLAEGLPALTFPVGGSVIPRLPERSNKDMFSAFRSEDSWPIEIWGHSDFRMVAFFHTANLYKDFVKEGGL